MQQLTEDVADVITNGVGIPDGPLQQIFSTGATSART
jgi:hypothetical protein